METERLEPVMYQVKVIAKGMEVIIEANAVACSNPKQRHSSIEAQAS
jgi:hypothetical protein